jgi:hypothetical protein
MIIQQLSTDWKLIGYKVQMGNFQKYWSQNVGQDFIVLDFFVGGDCAGGKGVCGRLMDMWKMFSYTSNLWK